MKHVISANKNRKAYLIDDDGSELELDVMNIEAEQRPFSPVELTLKCRYDGDEPARNAVPRHMQYISAIFNPPATIVLWKDGTKTVVKCDEKDTFDPKYGLALCFMKKALGNKSRHLNDVLHEVLSDPDDIAEKLGLPFAQGEEKEE